MEKEIEYDRLLHIATKMHLWIFLHSGDEKEVYKELGITDEEDAILGYSGKIILKEDKKIGKIDEFEFGDEFELNSKEIDIEKYFNNLANKINEIIDYINKEE